MAGPPLQVKPQSLNDYLEVQSKAVFQSGMSWKVVEAKWSGTREAFHNFDIHTIANLHEGDIDSLVQDARVIRNRRKLEAIVQNARQIIRLDREYGSFQGYLRAHGSFDATLRAMKRDFQFMGPTAVYYFLYVVGEEVPAHSEFEATYRK